MKKHSVVILTFFVIISLLTSFSIVSFAEEEDEGVYYPVPTTRAETTTKAEATTSSSSSIKGSIDKFLEDSGLGGTVDGILGSIDTEKIGDTFSGLVGGLSDSFSGLLNGNSSGYSNNYSQNEPTTAQQPVYNGSQSQLIIPSPQGGSSGNVPVQNQGEQTTAPQTAQNPPSQTQPIQQTSPAVTTASPNQQIQTEQTGSDRVWIFIAVVTVVIFGILFVLILLTRRTQYNSRVYDKTTLKSVKKARGYDDIIDDDGDPLDNILFTNNNNN